MQRAVDVVDRAVLAVDDEVQRHERGEGRVSSVIQLEAIRGHLLTVRGHMSGKLPRVENRVRGLGRIITDSWPLGNELGNLILAAEQAYLKLPS